MSEPPLTSRLVILIADEVDALDACLVCTIEDNHEYFELIPLEQTVLSQLRTPINQTNLYAILRHPSFLSLYIERCEAGLRYIQIISSLI